MAFSRFTIGIDLGTTNSALAYVDSLEEGIRSIVIPCPQLFASDSVEIESVLPSFLYIPPVAENIVNIFEPEACQGFVLGRYAERRMSETPGRVIQSAKSWLCHKGIDSRESILPWGSNELEQHEKLSPVYVSAKYLEYFKFIWNASIGKHSSEYRFENQDITITVPASFDAVAQRLTLEAASIAGYPDTVRLLEEPQAAFYHWLESPSNREQLTALSAKHGRSFVLVCDVGGGTSDFSLFKIQGSSIDSITRIAVSDHILLGGDNIDLTIAKYIENKLLEKNHKLGIKQWNYLLYNSRHIKESIMMGSKEIVADCANDDIIRLSLPPEGRALFSNSITLELERLEIKKIILDGFFPNCSLDVGLENSSIGLKEWGLPFAKDSAISKHLAYFISKSIASETQHLHRFDDISASDKLSARGIHIDAVLYTGGTLKSNILRTRLTNIISSWVDSSGSVCSGQEDQIIELSNTEMELGVARGAACYGAMRRIPSSIINAAYSQCIYLQLAQNQADHETSLVCILPYGTQTEKSVTLDNLVFELTLDCLASFKTYYSHNRRDDAGEIVNVNSDDFRELPILQTILKSKKLLNKNKDKRVNVILRSEINELGLLQIACIELCNNSEDKGIWRLDFNLRNNSDTNTEQKIPRKTTDNTSKSLSTQLKKVEDVILLHYGDNKHQKDIITTKSKKTSRPSSAKSITKDLELILGQPRQDWDIYVLRNIWDRLSCGITKRGRSLAHEMSWLSLAGWSLRPGFGADLDSYRMGQLWRIFDLGLSFPRESGSRVQWWILWRRVSGGLEKWQQDILYNSMHPLLHRKNNAPEHELIALAVSLERINVQQKIELANKLINLLSLENLSKQQHILWALERIGSRVPLYASSEYVLPPEHISGWLSIFENLDWNKSENKSLIRLFCNICRLTNDRYINISEELRTKIRRKLVASSVSSEQIRVLDEIKELNFEESCVMFGDSLPIGLRLVTKQL